VERGGIELGKGERALDLERDQRREKRNRGRRKLF
jgi:hypothetical protein